MMSDNQLLADARAILAGAQDKIDRLRSIDPFFIDLSLRENPVGARVGQTLQDKLEKDLLAARDRQASGAQAAQRRSN